MPSRQEKKRAKRYAKYLEVRDDVLESARASYKAGADAGFRVRGGASGVSRISARGVLKVRPHTKSGGEGGGGGGGGRFEKWGGGASGTIYEKWGGIPLQVRYLWAHRHTENIYMYLPTCYLGILHTRARMKYMPAKVNLL